MKMFLHKVFFVLFFLFTLSPFSFSQSWTRIAGGDVDDIGTSLAVFQNGDVYVAGIFQSVLIFSDTSYNSSQSNSQPFIAKFDSSGNRIWVKIIKANVYIDDEPRYPDIVTDDSANVYLAINFQDTLFVGADTLTGPTGWWRFCIIKYNSQGQYQWHKYYKEYYSFDLYNNWWLKDLRIDKEGKICVIGQTDVEITATGIDTLYGSFFVRFDGQGNKIFWREEYYADFLALDKLGNYYLAKYNIVKKFNSSNTLIWTKYPTGVISNMVADSIGNIYMQLNDSTVKKYSYNGIFAWKTNDAIKNIYDIDVNNSGNLVVVYSIANKKYIQKFSETGTSLGIAVYGQKADTAQPTSSFAITYDIVLSNNGLVYHTGYCDIGGGGMVFGSDTFLVGYGYDDVFISKYGQEQFIISNVDLNTSKLQITLFPNPFSYNINIYSESFELAAKAEVYDIYGSQIAKIELTENTIMDLSFLSAGVYMIYINTGEQIVIEKVIKL